MGALSPFIIVTTIKKIVEVLMKKMKFFQWLWTVLLWTIVVDSFPVEQDNRDGRAGPASDLGDGRWQDAGYVEYLANRTESPYRSPDCCVVEEIASNLNTAWYENALTEYRKMEKLEAIPKYSPKDKDDDWEMHLDIGRMFT